MSGMMYSQPDTALLDRFKTVFSLKQALLTVFRKIPKGFMRKTEVIIMRLIKIWDHKEISSHCAREKFVFRSGDRSHKPHRHTPLFSSISRLNNIFTVKNN